MSCHNESNIVAILNRPFPDFEGQNKHHSAMENRRKGTSSRRISHLRSTTVDVFDPNDFDGLIFDADWWAERAPLGLNSPRTGQ